MKMKAKLFWIVAITITAITIVIMCTIVFSNPRIGKYSKMITLNETTVLKAEAVSSRTYYVYFYSASDPSTKQKRTESILFEYATFVRRNRSKSGVYPIYLFNVDPYANLFTTAAYSETLSDNGMKNKSTFDSMIMHKMDLLMLLTVSNNRTGSVTYISELAIAKEFNNRINLVMG